jgi:DNA-directed RNA polymerase specialized sigma24 family protein
VDRPKYGSWLKGWEHCMIEKAALRIAPGDRDDFTAEMVRRLFELKRQDQKHIRHWKAYLGTLLRNEASDWHSRSTRTIPIVETEDEIDAAGVLSAVLAFPEVDRDRSMAIAAVWKELRPELRRLCEVLMRSDVDGKHARAARILGIHRNTVRIWSTKIREVFERHGF